MDNYLIDKQVLEQFIDGLIKKRGLELNDMNVSKEDLVGSLDKEIGIGIFGKLNNSQIIEFNSLLDVPSTSPDTIRHFFEDSGIDLQKIISDTLVHFETQFLGGQDE